MPQQPRPAAMSHICDAFYINPNHIPGSDAPFLLRCKDPATVRLTVSLGGDCYQVKRCEPCAEILRARQVTEATFEILSEEAI